DAVAPNGDRIQVGERTVHVVSWAKEFLFRTDQLETPVGSLSGGEQARVLMATLMRQPTDILFFDEPTNDLDIESIEVLEEKLVSFPGAVVLITHDRAMLDRVCTSIVGLHASGESRIYGSLSQWEAEEERQAEKLKTTAEKPAPASKPKTSFSKEDKREHSRLGTQIEKAEAVLSELHAKQQDPALANDHKAMHKLFQQLADAQAEVDRLYARWMELEEKLE
ncbi:MAG: ATP-binding cassette domain-containing protein, partial [Planctomycetes bacterium]|nr:ATP-binding cassette domain-containing protein [Planctomycetota bacterium]